jgi:dTDP-4-dehydrorhamnose 3,5-epimerase
VVDGRLDLPHGVSIRQLTCIADHRGSIVELDRRSWHPDDESVQWTLCRSGPHVLRGPHLHKQHADRLVVLDGVLIVGLLDLRRESSTPGLRASFPLAPLQVLTIPPCVVHGFFSQTATTSLNATSHEFNPDDDLEVRFDDPALGLEWPTGEPLLSRRDREAPTLSVLLERCAAAGLPVIEPAR